MKTTTEIKGSWIEIKGKLKQQLALLTNSDLLFARGREDELAGRRQAKIGRQKKKYKTISR